VNRLVLIGVGNAALAVNSLSSAYDTKYGTTRQSNKVDQLRKIGLKPLLLDNPLSRKTLETLEEASSGSHVVASFPPAQDDDERLSRAVRKASRVVYISSTGVYGGTAGIITEETPVESGNPAIEPRLHAEQTWRAVGAVVLRAPALYGPNYGLHLSLAAGTYKIPGDGSRFSSRIHLDDLAAIVLKALERAEPGSIYLVGDKNPSAQIEVVTWLCQRLKIELPGSIPIDQAHSTQRANRQVCADKVLRDLEVELLYPTYEEGFEQCLHGLASPRPQD
jgi:hypothetical protein